MSTAESPVIHPTALINSSAQLAGGVRVGPYALIGPSVQIGRDCHIGPYATVERNTRMGQGNIVHHHAVLGGDSQDRKFGGGPTWLEIGDNNVFREFVTVNRATGEGEATHIGDNGLFLAYCHIAHNCTVGSRIVLANGVQLAGIVTVEDDAALGGLVGVHQFCRIGAHAFVGGCSKVTQDIAPFVTADGHPARPRGLNLLGLRRCGWAEETIERLKKVYRLLFLRGLQLDEALAALDRDFGDFPEAMRLARFIRTSERGIARSRRAEEEDSPPA